MNEKQSYAKMLEIPVSTTNITYKASKKKKKKASLENIKQAIISKINGDKQEEIANQPEENVIAVEEVLMKKENLEQVLKQASPYQVVAVSLKSLNGQEIEEYGYQLGRHWGIGRKDINDGVLVIIAPNERQLRIEVGYGLEEILTDAISYQIVNKIMLPLAREGKYGEALVEGTDAVLKFINEKNTPVDVSNKTSSVKYGVVFLGIFILLFSIIANIRKMYVKIPTNVGDIVKNTKACYYADKTKRTVNRLKY